MVHHGTITVASWLDIERAADAIARYQPTVVAVEDCFIRPNDHTGIMLAKLVGRWEQALQSRGIRTILVLASRWQPAVLPITHRAKRAERKAAAQAFVLERFGLSVGEDAADAICLAVWGRDHGGGTEVPVDPRTPRLVQLAKPVDAPDARNCPPGGNSP